MKIHQIKKQNCILWRLIAWDVCLAEGIATTPEMAQIQRRNWWETKYTKNNFASR